MVFTIIRHFRSRRQLLLRRTGARLPRCGRTGGGCAFFCSVAPSSPRHQGGGPGHLARVSGSGFAAVCALGRPVWSPLPTASPFFERRRVAGATRAYALEAVAGNRFMAQRRSYWIPEALWANFSSHLVLRGCGTCHGPYDTPCIWPSTKERGTEMRCYLRWIGVVVFGASRRAPSRRGHSQ